VCLRCKKLGHSAENCGVILMSTHSGHYFNVLNNHYEYGRSLMIDLEGVKCLNLCESVYGHPNCRRNNLMMPQVYHTLIWPDYSAAEFIKMLPSIY